MFPQVDVIIPHYNGAQILIGCLLTLTKTEYPNYKIFVVDNGSTDDSIAKASKEFPCLTVLNTERNLGYAGGCNFGFYQTKGKYVVFLNNDTEQEPNWLMQLVQTAETNDEIASLQPKILSIQARNNSIKKFDYAGAAGGMIDQLGYPYCRGRIFNQCELDYGQYETAEDIFWSSGAALFVKRSALDIVGLFDEDFFAHMEEIDLCWRLWSAGYKIKVVPSSVVYHYGGATLSKDNPRKVYLNHRNNIMMILKNAEFFRLLWLLPTRLLLEVLSMIFYLISKKGDSAKSVISAFGWNVRYLFKQLSKRKAIDTLRKKSDTYIFKQCKSGFATVIKSIIMNPISQ